MQQANPLIGVVAVNEKHAEHGHSTRRNFGSERVTLNDLKTHETKNHSRMLTITSL